MSGFLVQAKVPGQVRYLLGQRRFCDPPQAQDLLMLDVVHKWFVVTEVQREEDSDNDDASVTFVTVEVDEQAYIDLWNSGNWLEIDEQGRFRKKAPCPVTPVAAN